MTEYAVIECKVNKKIIRMCQGVVYCFCFWKLFHMIVLYKGVYFNALQFQFGKLFQFEMFISFLILKIFARKKENA